MHASRKYGVILMIKNYNTSLDNAVHEFGLAKPPRYMSHYTMAKPDGACTSSLSCFYF